MFGDRLRLLRTEKKLTQLDLANLLKVSPSTIGMYEQCRRDPDSSTVSYLAEYFDVSVDYLLGNTEIRETADTILKKAIDGGQIHFHRTDGYDEDLPDSAKKEIADFIEYVKHKHKKK